jgi:hypothetical protein
VEEFNSGVRGLSKAFSDLVLTIYGKLLLNVFLSLWLNPKMVHYDNAWPHSSRSFDH